MRSKLPSAEKFETWVVSEVLPSIRKTGSYGQPAQTIQQVLSDPAAMRGLLLTYTEQVLALEATVAEQAPKVATLDLIATADGLLNITNTAKTLNIIPHAKLFRYLLENLWIYRRAGGKNYIAYQQRIQQGLLSHNGHIAVLSLFDQGKKKTWLLTGWEEDGGAGVNPATAYTDAGSGISQQQGASEKILRLNEHLVNSDAVSKVVDENGEPLVVYHGSKMPNIKYFDPSKKRSADWINVLFKKSRVGRVFYFRNSHTKRE